MNVATIFSHHHGWEHQDVQREIYREIDGAVATIMVLDRAIRYGNDNGTSVYDSCGLQLVDYKKFLHYSAFTRFSCRFMLSK